MKRMRCFIAINLSEDIKKELEKVQLLWREIPAKWTKKENFHITLLFLGIINKEKIPKIEEVIKKSISGIPYFDINILEALYAPNSLRIPTMIWAKIEESEYLTKLSQQLNKNIKSMEEIKIKLERNKKFSPHITLAKIKKWEFQRLDKENLPIIEKEFFLRFQVCSIELMESKLGKSGSKYSIIKSFPLSDQS